MKINIATIIIVLILVVGGTGLGVGQYFKGVEKDLIAMYDAKLAVNDSTIAAYHKENNLFKIQLETDSILIAEKQARITELENEVLEIEQDLEDAQVEIENFTMGEAIEFFVQYSGATDSRMLIQDADTSLIVSESGVRKVDSIFTEHKFQKLEMIALNGLIMEQDGVITTQLHSIDAYKELIVNKDAEIALQDENAIINKEKSDLEVQKYKDQRNKVGIAGVALFVLTLLLGGN